MAARLTCPRMCKGQSCDGVSNGLLNAGFESGLLLPWAREGKIWGYAQMANAYSGEWQCVEAQVCLKRRLTVGSSLYRSARILSLSSVRVLSSAGKYGVKLGVLPGAGGTLTQTVQLVPGSTYQVSFSARAVLVQVTTCGTVIAENSMAVSIAAAVVSIE